MSNAIVTSQELLAELTLMLATGGTLKGAQLTFDTTPSPSYTRNSVVGDLAPPTVPGVTLPHTIVWGTPFINSQGQAEVLGDNFPVVATTAPGSPVTVTGAAIIDSTSALLDVVDPFDTPQVIAAAHDGFVYTPRVVLG